MITLHDIIEAASAKVNGTLVLHRSMEVHPTFKAYKIFRYNLYQIVNGEKNLLFTIEEKKKALTDELEAVWEACDKIYLNKLIEWLTGNEYTALMNGI